MLSVKFRVTGMDALGRRMTKRAVKASQLHWLAHDFYARIQQRLKVMWRNLGVVSGPYGEGSRGWAPNTEWVAKAKGFNKPLFSTETTSQIMNKYRWDETVPTTGGDVRNLKFKFWNTHKAVQYLEAGHGGFEIQARKQALAIPYAPGVVVLCKSAQVGPMKPRWIQGFIQGDAKWLAEHAAKESLRV